LATVAVEVAGIELAGGAGGAPAAARLADDGGAAGCNVPDSATCGVDCVEGSAGAAERASSDLSSDPSLCFHQAQRGLDWHPANPATTAAIDNARMAERLMVMQPRLMSAQPMHTSEHRPDALFPANLHPAWLRATTDCAARGRPAAYLTNLRQAQSTTFTQRRDSGPSAPAR
jgi:hypothetical protein